MQGKIRLLLLATAALFSVSSCRNLVANSGEGSVDEWLKSEHSLIKKRITFLERENSVLIRENGDHREEIKQLKDRAGALRSEVGAWKTKYLHETETLNTELRELSEQKASLENESAQRIQELEAILEGDRQRFQAEIQALREELYQQTETFNLERQNARSEARKKQAALAQRIEGLDKDLAARDAVIESLRTLNEDLSRKLEKSLRDVGEKTLALQLLQKEVRALRRNPAPSGDTPVPPPSRIEANAP